MCQAGGEIILCDTCTKAFHLVCLEPELFEAPEGEWFCPHCEKDGTATAKQAENERLNAEANAKAVLEQIAGIQHNEFCHVCTDGGTLLCCETCKLSFHLDCLNPILTEIPNHEWYCPLCTCEKPKAVVKKLLTWRFKAPEEATAVAVEKKKTKVKAIKKPVLKIQFKKPAKKKAAADDDDEDYEAEEKDDNEKLDEDEDNEEKKEDDDDENDAEDEDDEEDDDDEDEDDDDFDGEDDDEDYGRKRRKKKSRNADESEEESSGIVIILIVRLKTGSCCFY